MSLFERRIQKDSNTCHPTTGEAVLRIQGLGDVIKVLGPLLSPFGIWNPIPLERDVINSPHFYNANKHISKKAIFKSQHKVFNYYFMQRKFSFLFCLILSHLLINAPKSKQCLSLSTPSLHSPPSLSLSIPQNFPV